MLSNQKKMNNLKLYTNLKDAKNLNNNNIKRRPLREINLNNRIINNVTNDNTKTKKILPKNNINNDNNKENINKKIEKNIKVEKKIIIKKIENTNFNFNKKLNWQIEDFELVKLLGSGGFANVKLAKEKDTNLPVAIKTINKELILNNQQHNFLKEIEIHSSLNHPNIIKFHGNFEDEKYLYIILEYFQGSNLYNKLKVQANKRYNETKAATYLSQIIEALKYCHEKSVIHCDIKPENVLVNSNNDIKLVDFGLADYKISNIQYMSPECFNNCSTSRDLWSLGVLTYELLIGQTPFYSTSEEKTVYNIIKNKLNLPKYLSKDATDFISKILVSKPENRLTLDAMLRHPWIKKNSKKQTKVQK